MLSENLMLHGPRPVHCCDQITVAVGYQHVRRRHEVLQCDLDGASKGSDVLIPQCTHGDCARFLRGDLPHNVRTRARVNLHVP